MYLMGIVDFRRTIYFKVTYVRPILEYCSSQYTVKNYAKIPVYYKNSLEYRAVSRVKNSHTGIKVIAFSYNVRNPEHI